LAKIDKSQYSKEEWRRIKEQRRLEKENKRFQEKMQSQEDLVSFHPAPTTTSSSKSKYYVLCLKHGTKYSADYVNRLYNMVKRNCTLDFEFACLTEDPKGIDKDVKILPLPKDLQGWWCKPYMYSKDLPLQGTILYIDLDVVISGNIDKLFEYKTDNWCTVRDFTRAMRPAWQKYNSSVVRFNTGQLDNVWTRYRDNKKEVERKNFGDQDWLWVATENNRAELFPDDWIQSWKWEVRKSRDLTPGARGKRKFTSIEDVIPNSECCICVFHGDPNPHNCEDPWVVRNWQ